MATLVKMIKDKLDKATGADVNREAASTRESLRKTLKERGYDYYTGVEKPGETRLGKWENGQIKLTPNPVNSPFNNRLNPKPKK